MKLDGPAKLLRIFLGETDKHHHVPLYEVIVQQARAQGLSGATVWRGLLGYGHGSRVRSAKILDLSANLPIVVEIVDEAAKIDDFLPIVDELIDQVGCGGLITVEQVQVIRHFHRR